jgi:maltooligosyltrehalose trehalohydrolase
MNFSARLGAIPVHNCSTTPPVKETQYTHFLVWAPQTQKVCLWLSPEDNFWVPDVRGLSVQTLIDNRWRCVPLDLIEEGYREQTVPDVPQGTLYLYELQTDGASFIAPDPGSYSQPSGVHGPSEVISLEFPWEDQEWKGIPWEDLVIYQTHPALFSTDLTLNGIIPRINYLKSLSSGLALYLLPIMEFPGQRNLGYDGAYFWAISNVLGGLRAAQNLVNQLHKNGIAVIFDMHVHNHFGPEGSYCWRYGPHFTDKHHTPWSSMAKNYDQPGAEGARRYIIETICFYFEVLHADGIRMDACHEVFDNSEIHIFEEMQEQVERLARKLDRPLFLLAEYNDDDPCLIMSRETGGYGWRGQLYEGLHHSEVTYFQPDLPGYFKDYAPTSNDYPVHRIAEILRRGYGHHYSEFLGKEVGRDIPPSVPVNRLVMPLSNVDQVANYFGLRFNQRVPFEAYKALAALALLLPGPPFFLCGDEIYSQDPVYFFCDHSDPAAIDGTRKGRFEEFGYFYSDRTQFPDPLDIRTFLKSRQHLDICTPEQQAVLDLFRKCLEIRKQMPAIRITDRASQSVIEFPETSLLQYDRVYRGEKVTLLLNLGNTSATVTIQGTVMFNWLDTSSADWFGPGYRRNPKSNSITVGPESLIVLMGHMNIPEEFDPVAL